MWDQPGAEELAKQAKEIIEQKPGSHVHGDKNRSRLILWRILLNIIPYQFQVACAAVDGMHRVITVLCASGGICPPQTDPELITCARAFTDGLKNTKEDGSRMGMERNDPTGDGETITNINTQLALVEWQPGGTTFDSAFFKVMEDKSRILQEIDSSGDKHTAKNVIVKIMNQCIEKLP